MKFRCFISIIFFFSLFPVYGQGGGRLILEKLGRKKRIVYQVEDRIILRLKGDKEEFSGLITGLYTNGLVVEDIYVLLKDIDYIKTVHTAGFLSPSNGPKMIIAGIGLLLVDQLNHSVMQGQAFRVPGDIAVASGIMVGSGIFWTSLKFRKFRPGRNRRIRIFVE